MNNNYIFEFDNNKLIIKKYLNKDIINKYIKINKINNSLDIKELNIIECNKLKEIPNYLLKLERLSICNYNNINHILKNFVNLKYLYIYNCIKYKIYS